MKLHACLAILPALCLLSLAGCDQSHAEQHHEEHHKIVVTSPVKKSVVTTEQYVCQIHSRRHIEVRAIEGGYLEAIPIKEGQAIKQGELMFRILPTLFEATLDAEKAEANLAQIEFSNTQRLYQQHVVSDQEVALAQAKLTKALANMKKAQAELNFTELKAPFDGIIDRLHEQQGSLIEEGDILTTLSDNDVMWVYFNVPESRYLEYRANLEEEQKLAEQEAAALESSDAPTPAVAGDSPPAPTGDSPSAPVTAQAPPATSSTDNSHAASNLHIELVLANRQKFDQHGHIAAIEADFNNETGNIAFRADFPNPDALLRHGQTGTVLIHRTLDGALVIPQRATFEILAKRYVYVVGKDEIVHQREIEIQHELEDIYVIKSGIDDGDKIVLEGVLQVRDGEKTEYEFKDPEAVLSDLKNTAE
jgi:membrane fusion protein, multidrug efflux system